jgi:hypothetical protein
MYIIDYYAKLITYKRICLVNPTVLTIFTDLTTSYGRKIRKETVLD